MTDTTVLIVPGLRDHVPDHWQTHLQARLPNARTVPPLEVDRLNLAARVEAIERTIAGIEGPVLIAAHSAGVIMTVHWALTTGRPVRGALLACPPDLEKPLPEGYPTLAALAEGGWLPVPRQRLPFPSIVTVSESDPLCALARATELGRAWGGDVVNLGKVGHLNPASGHGLWVQSETFLEALTK
jgi:hypothetical protein